MNRELHELLKLNLGWYDQTDRTAEDDFLYHLSRLIRAHESALRELAKGEAAPPRLDKAPTVPGWYTFQPTVDFATAHNPGSWAVRLYRDPPGTLPLDAQCFPFDSDTDETLVPNSPLPIHDLPAGTWHGPLLEPEG